MISPTACAGLAAAVGIADVVLARTLGITDKDWRTLPRRHRLVTAVPLVLALVLFWLSGWTWWVLASYLVFPVGAAALLERLAHVRKRRASRAEAVRREQEDRERFWQSGSAHEPAGADAPGSVPLSGPAAPPTIPRPAPRLPQDRRPKGSPRQP